MGFFATFWSWLNGQLTTYIGDNTARLASALEPAMVTLATVYVMAWGYLHLTGKIDEPVVTGLKRLLTVALILGVGLRLWLYNTLIVDTFYRAPAQLAAAMVGSADPVGTIDAIWESGGAVAGELWTKAAVSFSGLGFYIAAAVVWCLVGLLCAYAMFLIALSTIALAVLLALGPLFIGSLFFDASKRFFAAWIVQLANYALITVLTVMVAALLLRVVQSYAAQTAARGAAIQTVDALHMMLMAVLVFLILRQVMPIASGLAAGASLTSFGLMSRFADRRIHSARRRGGEATGSGWGVWHGRLAKRRAAHADDEVPAAADRSDGNEYGKSGSGIKAGSGPEALGRGWRDSNR
jgi:type IV secretion system protein VirB6